MSLLEVTQILEQPADAELTLTLPFETRQKSRFRAECDNALQVGVKLPRGKILRDGDCVQAVDGQVIKIQAADETVSEVTTDDALLLSRACYHLGNRHVPLQIGEGFVRYNHDHVLDDMVKSLGLTVTVRQAPFEPESGAYSGHAHGHSHSHGHGHSHG